MEANGRRLTIAPELLDRHDKYAAAKREAKKKNTFSTQMLMLNAIEQAQVEGLCLAFLSKYFVLAPKIIMQ